MDLTVRVVKDGSDVKEWEIYKTLVEDIKIFLEEKYFTKAKFQPTPDADAEEEAKGDGPEGGIKIFMIENKGHLGFKKDLIENKEGLDYEHSVIVIAALAKYHATSFCFRKHGEVEMFENYPVLKDGLSFPDVSEETIK